jgi:DNA invertase Pin-like site-specific DNA recombinase
MLGIYCRTSRETDIQSETISQQRIAGIKFAESNNYEYEIYEDEGKSGFKNSDDEQDPFSNRPSFTKLINDIKDKKIDKVWVWEHSRLSRNQYASAFIFQVFDKYKIILYENQKQLDLNDPQFRFMRQIFDAVSEYERQLIVARTTRGLRKRIDEGKRAHHKLYGYQKDGKDQNGYTKWIPVESEIENYKHILKRFNEGASLRKITFEVYDKNKMENWGLPSYAHFLGRILRGYQYTGYQLTIEGNEIYKKFRNYEIDSLQILKDKKYWIKSIPYPIELISIEDWIKVCEKLQIRGMKQHNTRKERTLRASKDIATGLIQCSDCGNRFYYKEQKITNKKTGRNDIYITYFHHQFFNNKMCSQKPKSFNIEYINEIFKTFFFYFYVVFDNTAELMKQSQRSIKQTQLKLKEEIANIEKSISKIEKQISKFQTALESTDDVEVIKVLAKNISSSEERHNKQRIELSKLKIEYELQNEKFNLSLLEMTYYDVVERVNDWFFKLNIEEQRNELIRTIRSCKIFSHYIIIEAGKVVFFFDILSKWVFDMGLIETLNKDENYKEHFVGGKGKMKVRQFRDETILRMDLNKGDRRMLVSKYLNEKMKIQYDLSEVEYFVSFVRMKGVLEQTS